MFFEFGDRMMNWYFGSLAGTIMFFTYYFLEVVKRPLLLTYPDKFKTFLENKVPLIKKKFWPTVWCFESRAHTIISSFVRDYSISNIVYSREILLLKDGGEIVLDWLSPPSAGSESPVVILLPGLTGGSQADYIKGLVGVCQDIGIHAVVFNNRGIGGIALKTPKMYCACGFEDLCEVLEHVHHKYPASHIGATGISMGGLILGNYLAGAGGEATKYLKAAMLISVPWDVFKGTVSIERPIINLLLNYHLARSLCRLLSRARDVFEGAGCGNIESCLKSSTIREFDSKFTSKQFGYKDVDDYYSHATLHNKLHKIRLPTLCLSAADDPFQPYEGIPVEAAKSSEHVAIVVTSRGGHIGFMEGVWPFGKTQYMWEMFRQYFEAMFYQNGYKLFEAENLK